MNFQVSESRYLQVQEEKKSASSMLAEMRTQVTTPQYECLFPLKKSLNIQISEAQDYKECTDVVRLNQN